MFAYFDFVNHRAKLVKTPIPIERETMSEAIISIPERRLDSTNYQTYIKQIEQCIKAGCTQVFVDLDLVEFLDSHGLSVLVKGWRLAQQKQVHFRVRGVRHEPVKMVFQITNIERLFPVEYDCNNSLQIEV